MNRWLIWSIFAILWTVALEVPVRDAENLPGGEFIVGKKYVLAKTAHVLVYAAFAVLSAWVPMPVRYRFLMMLFLMGHAWGTEMLQEALEPWCHRGGSLSDVGLDLIGIALGIAMSWKWWTKDNEPDAQARK